MPDLFEIIAAHEDSTRSERRLRTTTLTPKGAATVAARQLARALAQVDDSTDRIAVVNVVLSELARLRTNDVATG